MHYHSCSGSLTGSSTSYYVILAFNIILVSLTSYFFSLMILVIFFIEQVIMLSVFLF